MIRKNIIISIVLLTIFFTSCKDEGIYWGKTNYYENFLFVKYKPVIMEQTLIFEFNEDAQNFLDSNVEFEVVKKNENGDIEIAQDIILYKNNEKCENNILSIHKEDKEVSIGIEFTDKARYGTHTLFLREKGISGIDRIDYQELGTGLCVIKTKKTNPLLIGFIWFLIILLGICIVWIILIKPLVYESFKVKQLIITTDRFRSLKIRACKKVVCSKKNQKQSFVNQLFTGKIVFVHDDFFTDDLIITPRDKKRVRIKMPSGFESTSNTVTIGETMTITNTLVSPNKSAIIQIN